MKNAHRITVRAANSCRPKSSGVRNISRSKLSSYLLAPMLKKQPKMFLRYSCIDWLYKNLPIRILWWFMKNFDLCSTTLHEHLGYCFCITNTAIKSNARGPCCWENAIFGQISETKFSLVNRINWYTYLDLI